jgi:hypothetical protein
MSPVLTEPRFAPLTYNLLTSTNLQYNAPTSPTLPFIMTFTDTGTSLKVEINTNDAAMKNTYNMNLVAKFPNFNPAYSVSATLKISILLSCGTNVITPSVSTQDTMYHVAGEGSKMYLIPLYTEIYNGICGSISYKSLKVPSFVNFASGTSGLKFTANAPSTSISNTYDMDVKAMLSGASNVIKTYRLYLIQLSTTFITAPAIPDLQFYVGESKLSYTIPAFTISDTRFPVKYTLTNTFGFAIDAAVISFV